MARRRCVRFSECGVFVSSGSLCPAHRAGRQAARNAERPRARAAVAAAPWCHCSGACGKDHGGVCGATTDLTAEHVTPISRGGTGGLLVPWCRSCNSRRGAR